MMIARHVHDALDNGEVDYELIEHPPSSSAILSAAGSHVSSGQVAKAVLITTSGSYVLAVIPSNQRVALRDLKDQLGRKYHLAREDEIEAIFSDCEPGAIPALGPGYGLPTIIDESLAIEPDIYFEAGDHISLVHVSQRDFAKLMQEAYRGHISEPWPDDS